MSQNNGKIMIGEEAYYGRLADVQEELVFMVQFTAKKKTAGAEKERSAAFIGFSSYTEAARWINSHRELSIHEITRVGQADSFQRIFADIDYVREAGDNPRDIDEAYDLLIESINEVLRAGGVSDLSRISLCGSTAAKFGKHEIINSALIDCSHYKCFNKRVCALFAVKLFENGIPSKYEKIIDSGVYNKNHPLRVHLSPKAGAIGGPVYKITGEGANNDRFDYRTLIAFNPQYDDERVEIYECGEDCLTKQVREPIKVEVGDEKMKAVEAALMKLNRGLTARKVKGNIIELLDDHSKPCYVCAQQHDNENPYVVIHPRSARMYCRRSKTPNGKDISTLLLNFAQFRKYEAPAPVNLAADSLEEIPGTCIIRTQNERVTGLGHNLGLFDTIYLKSDLNTGKSFAFRAYMREAVKKNPNYSCVIITYRVNLCSEIHAKNLTTDETPVFLFENYMNLSGPIKLSEHPRIIIQYESLNRLVLDAEPNICFIDEAASLLQQTQSGLNRQKMGLNLAQFENLLHTSQKLLACDALLSIEAMKAYETMRRESTRAFWINESKPWRPIIRDIEDVSDWRGSIVKDLQAGKRLYITMTKGEKDIKALEHVIKAAMGQNYPVLCIYGGGENNQEIMSNINAELSKYSAVIASPCMAAGVSFDVRDYFDKVYSYVSTSGPTSTDVIQSLRRVRHTKENSVTFCCVTNAQNLPVIPEDIIEQEESRLYYNSEDYIALGMPVRIRGAKSFFVNPADKLFRFTVAVKSCVNRSLRDIKADVWAYLALHEATFEERVCKAPEAASARKAERMQFAGFKQTVKIENLTKIAEAPIISDSEYDDIKVLRRLTAVKRAQLEKYQLMRLYGLKPLKYSEGQLVVDEGPNSIISNVERLKVYNDDDIKNMYRAAPLRDLSYEEVAAIDAKTLAALTDVEKMTCGLHLAKHCVIKEIVRLVNADGAADKLKPALIKYFDDLKFQNHPVVANLARINESSVIKAACKIIRDYGYHIQRQKENNGTSKKSTNYCIVDVLDYYFDPIKNETELNAYIPKPGADFKPRICFRFPNSL